MVSDAEFVWALEEDPESLLPFGSIQTASHWGKEHIYDSLLEWDRNLKVRPALAMNFETPDERTYVFRLRPNAVFHDGTPVSAVDVKHSLELQADPPAPGRRSYLATPAIAGVDAIASDTVRVEMAVPDASLPGYLAWGRYSPVVPENLYKRLDPTKAGLGTGPFVLNEYLPGEVLRFTHFPAFWRPGLPRLKSLDLVIIPDEDDRATALRKGLIHGGTFSGSEARELSRSENLQLLTGLTAAHRELQIALKSDRRRPWHDRRVRQAVNFAIDRDELIEKVYYGAAEYTSIVPRGHGDWPLVDEEVRLRQAHDLTRATALMQAAGFSRGFEVDLLTLTQPSDLVGCANVLRRQLRRIGIDCNLDERGSSDFFRRRDAGEYDFAITARGIRGDVSGYVSEFATSAPNYYQRFGAWHPAASLDAWIERGISTLKHEARLAIYRTLQRMILDECVHIPLCQPYKHQVVQNSVQDMYVAFSDFNTGLRQAKLVSQLHANEIGGPAID